MSPKPGAPAAQREGLLPPAGLQAHGTVNVFLSVTGNSGGSFVPVVCLDRLAPRAMLLFSGSVSAGSLWPPTCRNRSVLQGGRGRPGRGCSEILGLCLLIWDPETESGKPGSVFLPSCSKESRIVPSDAPPFLDSIHVLPAGPSYLLQGHLCGSLPNMSQLAPGHRLLPSLSLGK